jgi:hypothetical protein
MKHCSFYPCSVSSSIDSLNGMKSRVIENKEIFIFILEVKFDEKTSIHYIKRQIKISLPGLFLSFYRSHYFVACFLLRHILS